ncbi:MAG: hypothetical protein DMD74_07545 [Gemmatimonadetes bacterium]|nr:MAG: hypothetical protein DMD74_07545 [Gemmatimonadota bacterium]
MRHSPPGWAALVLGLAGAAGGGTAPSRSAGLTAVAPLPPALASVTPDFEWSAIGFTPPVTYRLRVARDSTLAAPFLDTTLTDQTSYAQRRPIKPYGPICWRVDATDAMAVTASTGRVGPIAVPAWVTLTTLDNPQGTATPDIQPTFTWRSPAVAAPPGPFRYDMFVIRLGQPFPTYGVGGLVDTTFTITEPLERNVQYRWKVVAHLGADSSVTDSRGPFLVLDPTVPGATILYQNFPNPFPTGAQGATCLWFDLATTSRTELAVFDLRGNPVRHFVPGPDFPGVLDAGRYGRGGPGGPTCDPRLSWDGRDDGGDLVPAGVYLYKLRVGDVILFKRIVFRGRIP